MLHMTLSIMTLSILTFRIMPEHCYAECHFCRMSQLILLRWVSLCEVSLCLASRCLSFRPWLKLTKDRLCLLYLLMLNIYCVLVFISKTFRRKIWNKVFLHLKSCRHKGFGCEGIILGKEDYELKFWKTVAARGYSQSLLRSSYVPFLGYGALTWKACL